MAEVKLWKRPESVPIPTIWATYESKKPMTNGRTPRFRIQDYTEEWKDHVIDNMTNFFLRDEPLCKSLNLREDPLAVEEFKGLILAFLDRKMGLVAIVENLEELDDENLPILAGCLEHENHEAEKLYYCNYEEYCTSRRTNKRLIKAKELGIGYCPNTSRSEKIQKILDSLEILEHQKDFFKYYGVTESMYALGLSVDSTFRGHGLGYEILKARFPLCKAVGIQVTVTVFTAGAAQRSAEKAGFETLAELFYDEYKDEHGEIVFKVDSPKSMKLMGIRIL